MIKVYSVDVPIIIFDLASHNEIKHCLLDILEKSFHTSSINKDDNITKTDYFIDIREPRLYVDVLVPYLIEPLKDVYENIIKLEWRDTISFATFWFQQYHQNDRHEWHNHPGSNYNAVYYLELPEDGPRTELKSPISEDVIVPEVKEGQVLIFPSFFLHRSPESKSHKRKSIIAFNLI